MNRAINFANDMPLLLMIMTSFMLCHDGVLATDDDSVMFHDLLTKWQNVTDHCANVNVVAEIVSQGAEKYTLQYDVYCKNGDWDASVISQTYGNARYLGIGKESHCINRLPENRNNSANYVAKKDPRRAFDFMQRHLWVYWLAAHGDGKNAMISITEYYKAARILSKFQKEYDGKPCLCFLIKDRNNAEIEFAFSINDDLFPCRVEHKGELKSTYVVKSWSLHADSIKLPKEVILHREMMGKSAEARINFKSVHINPKYPADFLQIKYPISCALYNSFDNTCFVVSETGQLLRPCTTSSGTPINFLGTSTTADVQAQERLSWLYYAVPILLGILGILAVIFWKKRSGSTA